MPLRIQNKEMARVDALRKSWQREPDTGKGFGEYIDIDHYHSGQLPLFIRKEKLQGLAGKPIFQSRVPGGQLFNKGPSGSESPCQLNLLDILSLERSWAVAEHQAVKHGTVGKKFGVTAKMARQPADAERGTTHKTAQLTLVDKETLKSEVPVTYLNEAMVERCLEASHSHVPSFHFPMGTKVSDREEIMKQAVADAEVTAMMTSPNRGHGDVRNEGANMGITPARLVNKRAPSPQKIARNESSLSMMSSGTMMSERTFHSPGIPEENFNKAGYSTMPMGLPHITFAKKPKPPKMAPWMTRRGSLSTVKSKGWKERDMTRSLSSLGP